MDRHENHVSPAVKEFHHFVHPAPVVFHLHKTTENTHAVVYMHDIVSHVEGAEVVEGELLGLFHRAADVHAVEAVENLMVRVAAHFVVMVDETGMDVLSLHEFRKEGVRVLEHDGTEPLQLAFLFSEDIYLITFLQAGADIRNQQFEVLVEYRLRGNVEFDAFRLVFPEGNIHINMLERLIENMVVKKLEGYLSSSGQTANGGGMRREIPESDIPVVAEGIAQEVSAGAKMMLDNLGSFFEDGE